LPNSVSLSVTIRSLPLTRSETTASRGTPTHSNFSFSDHKLSPASSCHQIFQGCLAEPSAHHLGRRFSTKLRLAISTALRRSAIRTECASAIQLSSARRTCDKYFLLMPAYYNEIRTHLALGKDAPLGRAVQRTGVIVAIPILSGLHHHYVRI